MDLAHGRRQVERTVLHELDCMMGVIIREEGEIGILICSEKREDGVSCATSDFCDSDRSSARLSSRYEFREFIVQPSLRLS